MKRDRIFFVIMYASAIFFPFLVPKSHIFIAVSLVIGYLIYAYITFKGESADIMHAEELYFKRFFIRSHQPAGLPLIIFQVLSALAIMVGGAHVFVGNLEKLSVTWGMNPLLFALLIAPVATELPEKFNSVTWTLKGRDTLAMGNITGAMVFQSTFPVSIGLLFTDWNISGFALFSAILALISAVVAIADIQIRGRLSPVTVLLGGLFYIIYAASIFLK